MDFCALHSFQIGSRSHQAVHLMGTGPPFSGDEASGTWSWPLTSHLVQSLRSTGAVLPHHLYAFMACTGTTPTLPWFLPTFKWMMANNQHTTGESLSFHHFHLVTKGDRLATGWTVRGSNHGDGEIFRTRQDRPWGPPSLLHNGHWVSFSGVNRLWRGFERPPLSRAEIKERVELYLYSPSGPSRPVARWTLLLLLPYKRRRWCTTVNT